MSEQSIGENEISFRQTKSSKVSSAVSNVRGLVRRFLQRGAPISSSTQASPNVPIQENMPESPQRRTLTTPLDETLLRMEKNGDLASLLAKDHIAEAPMVNSTVYVGLEKLTDINSKEEFLSTAIELASNETQRQAYKQKVRNLQREREEIYERNGIKEILEQAAHNREPVTAPKDMLRVLISHKIPQLPPVREGFRRMYRGEGPYTKKTDDLDTGAWFSPDPQIAFVYPAMPMGNSRAVFVDVSINDLLRYHAPNVPGYIGSGKVHEYLLPRAATEVKREFVRFLTVDQQDDPWSGSNNDSDVSK